MTNEIHVIQVIDSLHIGGAEVLSVNIANSMFEKGLKSHLCATRTEGDLKRALQPGVGYCFLDKKKSFDLNAITKLKNYIIRHKISIIHAHSSSFFIAVCVKFIYPRVKIIWHDHYGKSEYLKNTSRLATQFSSFFFDKVIVVNSRLLNWGKKHLWGKNICLLNNFPVFVDQEVKTILQGFPKMRIVHVAGFREQKDHLNLLKAFCKVLEAHPKHTLHCVGQIYDDAYSNSVIDFVNNNNLNENVYFYGVCSDIKNILKQADIGVLSSNSEGLPISLLEYGLANIPAVVTDVGECSKVIIDKDVLVEPKNHIALASALSKMISEEGMRDRVKKNLYQVVKNEYSQKEMSNKIIDIYKELC